MAKISYDGRSIWSPVMFDPINCLIFIQTDRGMYAEKEEGNIKYQIDTNIQMYNIDCIFYCSKIHLINILYIFQ